MHQTIATSQGEIAYSVIGAGPPIVLLRGLGRTTEHWLGYERDLAKHFRVVTLDLRGMGRSGVPCTWTTSIFDMARDVTAVLDHLAIGQAHVVGVSLGGMVGLALGLSAPERCLSIVAINTSIAGLGTLRLHPEAIKGMAKAVLEMRGAAPQMRLVDLLVGPACPQGRRLEVAEAYAEITARDGTIYLDTVFKQLAAAARFRVKRRLKALEVPALIVYGTHDRFVPNINSRKLVRYLPHATLVPIDGAGHEVTIDKSAELTAILVDWVARQGTRRAEAAEAGAQDGKNAADAAGPARKVLNFARGRRRGTQGET